MSRRVGTVVVGAGPAGLATSHHLAAAGHDHVVLERGRVGDTWRTQRWDAFRLNTPGWMNGLDDADGFGTAADLVAALERRAADLPVIENVEVGAVWRQRGGGYLVAAGDEVYDADHVVAASGAQRVPHIPALAHDVPGRDVEHLHIADYRSAGELPPGAVLVIGSAQSGGQVAADLLRSGRRVLVATSRVGRVPRHHRGRDIMAWWRDMGRLDAGAETAEAHTRRAAQPLLAGGASLSLQTLARSGAVLLGRLAAAGDGRLWFTGDPVEHARYGDEVARRQRAAVDRWLAATGRRAPAAEPDETPLTHDEVAQQTVVDLRRAGIRTVIWATGFGGDYSWLRMPILDTAGGPINRGVETVSRGLFVVGVPWLRLRSSGNLYGIERDAAAIAARVAGADRVPERLAS